MMLSFKTWGKARIFKFLCYFIEEIKIEIHGGCIYVNELTVIYQCVLLIEICKLLTKIILV